MKTVEQHPIDDNQESLLGPHLAYAGVIAVACIGTSVYEFNHQEPLVGALTAVGLGAVAMGFAIKGLLSRPRSQDQ